jgi:hypothetical protein
MGGGGLMREPSLRVLEIPSAEQLTLRWQIEEVVEAVSPQLQTSSGTWL